MLFLFSLRCLVTWPAGPLKKTWMYIGLKAYNTSTPGTPVCKEWDCPDCFQERTKDNDVQVGQLPSQRHRKKKWKTYLLPERTTEPERTKYVVNTLLHSGVFCISIKRFIHSCLNFLSQRKPNWSIMFFFRVCFLLFFRFCCFLFNGS